MSAVNPYAPPQATVADVQEDGDQATQPVKFFSASGRVGRLRYLAHILGGYILFGLFAGVVGGLVAAWGMPTLATVIIVVGVVTYLVFLVLKSIQRSHDMDWSGWSSLAALIPLVGLIWIFKPGTEGRNSYGPPPVPNTLGVKVVALLLPVIAMIGIIAAVALPAYSDYQKRANAAQGK